MKKLILFAIVAIMAASCTTTTTVKTARTEGVPYSMYNASIADLKVVGPRISYTMRPSKDIQICGLNNVKQAAISEALNANGNADLLLEPQFVISQKRSFFKKEVTSITVTGIPAQYVNVRSMHDSVWVNRVFRNYDNGDGKASSANKGGVLQFIKGKKKF
ncbi:MAG: hypothetical protein J1F13_05525 [Prevotellaceae bacterium]|nr:hypothetical protein [Prevotellaceae bacterium]